MFICLEVTITRLFPTKGDYFKFQMGYDFSTLVKSSIFIDFKVIEEIIGQLTCCPIMVIRKCPPLKRRPKTITPYI
jgi:hypothetical protein